MGIFQNIKSYKQKQDFFPSFISILFNPFYIARRNLVKHIRELAPQLNGRLLDVGCGRKPYKSLFHVKEYIGLDIEQSGHSHENEDVDVFYDGTIFPFENESFDSVLCNQVLEHVFNPDEFLQEIHRVLKNDGKFLLTVPFAWDEHEQPYDYARYSSFGLKHLLEKNGFNVIKHNKSAPGFLTIYQLCSGSIYKSFLTKSFVFNTIINFIFIFPVNFLGIIFSIILPKNPDIYLDNVVLIEKSKK